MGQDTRPGKMALSIRLNSCYHGKASMERTQEPEHHGESMMIYEHRTYRIPEGRMPDILDRFNRYHVRHLRKARQSKSSVSGPEKGCQRTHLPLRIRKRRGDGISVGFIPRGPRMDRGPGTDRSQRAHRGRGGLRCARPDLLLAVADRGVDRSADLGSDAVPVIWAGASVRNRPPGTPIPQGPYPIRWRAMPYHLPILS